MAKNRASTYAISVFSIDGLDEFSEYSWSNDKLTLHTLKR